ncbi:response regulator [Micromonospora chaiyaphumensis]|uniref:Two component transcriptional regulator, LuxR family n=1 Tax=Micromonospora chaiyaphumensis TaxID=307119 RepID=A0A1C4XKI7_9ACTN|nr:response regulator transcription factor [Micromonospora chaiyaphumensis]SCF08906.1 two component transcriptional regulator, LuxR family [Micromonospora chaiyaphumensis]
MIRTLIADDEQLVRAGLRLILEAAPDIAVVGEAADGDEALAAAVRLRPDVVLLDVRMPGTDGLAAAPRIVAEGPRVVMLTTFDRDEYVHAALRAGAVGFLLKDTPPRELAAAVRTVAAGNAMLAPTVTRRLISSFAERGPARREAARQRLARLTGREAAIVREVARGDANADVARRLGTSEATVKTHVSRALAKLGVANRVQLAILVHDADLLAE